MGREFLSESLKKDDFYCNCLAKHKLKFIHLKSNLRLLLMRSTFFPNGVKPYGIIIKKTHTSLQKQ